MIQKLARLKRFNLFMGSLHAIQSLVVAIISNDSARSITAPYLQFDQATESLVPASRVLFDVGIGPLVALFFALSALAHLYVGTIGNKRYNANLKKGINKARWIEYALSASLMIVLIAMLAGIFDVVSLLGLFTLTAVMNLMGLVMEIHNQTTKKTNWLSFNIGCLAGIIPWLAIAIVCLLYTSPSPRD